MKPSLSNHPNGAFVTGDEGSTCQLDPMEPTISRTAAYDGIDFNIIFEASQVLSSTVDYDELLYQIAHLMLQNSGGDHCMLLLPHRVEASQSEGGQAESGRLERQQQEIGQPEIEQATEWQVKAIATPQSTERCSSAHHSNAQNPDSQNPDSQNPDSHCSITPEDYPALPLKLIEHVEQTQTAVIINDLQTDLPIIDETLTESRPRSILCQPLVNQNKVIGLIYLTHRTNSGIFTNIQQAALSFLGSQAAIALDNVRLHKIEQEKNKQIERSEANLRSLYENAADPVLLLGEKSFVDCNRAAVELFEATHKSQLCAVHPADISPPFQADGQTSFDKAQAMIQQGIENGSHRFEWQHQTLTGRVFWAEVVLTPLRYKGQTVVHSLVRDISQRKANELQILEKSVALEQALSQLKHSQAQVIQAEKMSALGNLVAGVAHEINNPIGFLNGSIKNAQNYIQDLQSQLDLYQQHYPNPVEAIQDNAEEIDLEFVCEDLPKLLNSMQGAMNRIKSISTSLRTFSRADTEHKVSTNLHEGLDSTLLILKYRLKANEKRPEITVIKDYGQLPSIDCFPGQLNQVFMNVLANAIDVFDEVAEQSTFAALKDTLQQIVIKTGVCVDEKVVEIRIADNGKGMSAEVKARIFDHLFTTKEVGKGTGLGLGIAHQIIVEAHDGTIEVQSEPGEGTEFCIRLPF